MIKSGDMNINPMVPNDGPVTPPAKTPMSHRDLKYSTGIASDAYLRSKEDIRKGLLANTEKADALMNVGSFGADIPGVAGAIRQRYSRKFGLQDREFQLQADMMADQAKFERLERAAVLTNQELKLNEEKRRIKRMKEMAKRQQRGAIVGQVLGIAGGVVGGIYGGPAGAAAGYSIGTSIGSAAGSNM